MKKLHPLVTEFFICGRKSFFDFHCTIIFREPKDVRLNTTYTLLHHEHCLKSAQIRSFFWSVFFRIRTEYVEIRSISPYSVQIRKNTDQKKTPYLDTFPYLELQQIVSTDSSDIYLDVFKRLYKNFIAETSLTLVIDTTLSSDNALLFERIYWWNYKK